MVAEFGVKSTSYDVVRRYSENKVGKFNSADVIANCPTASRSSVLAALKRLVEEGIIIKNGSGRGTFYVRADSRDEWDMSR